MAKIGLKYTNENKSISFVKLRPIYEVSFLKRSFRFEKIVNRWVAPISLETISNELDWTKKIDSNAISKDKAMIAIRELSLHGKAKFDKHFEDIKNAVRDNIDSVPPTGGWPRDWMEVLLTVTQLEHILC